MAPTKRVWMDGKLVDWEKANVHIMTHGLHYGGGVFEGIRVYKTSKGRAVFRLKDHMIRFYDSAKVIELKIPYSLDELCKATKDVVRANGPDIDYIRHIAYYGTGTVGLNPVKLPTKVAIACAHMGSYLGEEQQKFGAKLITSSWEKPSNRAAALNAKICGNDVNSVLARLEAVHRGADEALMLDANGNVAEGTGENIFMVKDGKLSTPGMASGILRGITRDSVMHLAAELGYDIAERDITRSELYVADEVFLTGTAAEVLPVRSIDDREIGEGRPGPITLNLQKEFSNVSTGKNKRHLLWLDYVD